MVGLELNSLIAILLYTQTIVIPILGGLFLSIRNERKKQQRLFQELLENQRRRSSFLRKF